MIKLGLFDSGDDGCPLSDSSMTRHGLRRIPNPLNWNPNTGVFLIDENDRKLRGWYPCHPDEIAIPTYFVSYETLVFVGFTKIKAMELWESYKLENNTADPSPPLDNKMDLDQHSSKLLLHAQRYLKANARHTTNFRHLQDLGFDNSTVYVGFQPSMRYSNRSPALDIVDIFQPLGRDTNLLAWALRSSFRRFIFLCQLDSMLSMLEEAKLQKLCTDNTRPTLGHWKYVIRIFEHDENRNVFLLQDDEAFHSELPDADTKGSDVVELYAENKEGTSLHGDTSEAEKEKAASLYGDISEAEMEEGVFPDKDTSEAETPDSFPYYSHSASEHRESLNAQLSEEGEVPDPKLLNAKNKGSKARDIVIPDSSLLKGEISAPEAKTQDEKFSRLLPKANLALEFPKNGKTTAETAETKEMAGETSKAETSISKTGDVEMPDAVISKEDPKRDTKAPAAPLRTGKLDEDKKPRVADAEILTTTSPPHFMSRN